jgi:transcriptional regulator GlxA family with amidase domain
MAAPRRVAFLLFDQVEVLDFAGPFEAFGVTGWSRPPLPFDVYTVAQSRHPVLARNNLSINPDYDFASCPVPDVFVVPGGPGTRREMHNASLIDFVVQNVAVCEHVLSVCTGALLLAKAGQLDGLEATTHKGALDELRAMAPKTTIRPDARGVDNGKIVLSTGVSAGTDMAIYLISRLLGLDTAIETADFMQYDWRYREADGNAVIRKAA